MYSIIFNLMFTIVPILVLCGFIFTIATIISPKLRSKFMSKQIKATKYKIDENEEILKCGYEQKLDYILLNFLVDLLLLFSVAIVLRRQTNLRRLLLGALVGGITILSMFVEMNSVVLFLVKIVISVLMCLIAFGYRNIKYTLNNLFYLYTSSILLFIFNLNVYLG